MWILIGLGTLAAFAGRTLRRRTSASPRTKELSMTRLATMQETARGRGVVPVLLVAAFTASFAQTVVIAALPAFGREEHATVTQAAWILTAFMLASAVATPIAGRLGDLFGYRRVLIACLGCFAAGTVIAGAAADAHVFGWVVAGRAIQGVSGGTFPLAFGVVRTAVPPPRVPGVIALLSALFGIGGSAGMVAAGPLVDGPGTAWLFWCTLILVLAALVAAVAVLPADRPADRGRVDLSGAALLSGALVGLLLLISQGRAWGWGSAAIVGLAAVTVLLLAGFAVVELRVRDPLIDLRLMRVCALAVTNLATVVIAAAMFGVIALVPQYVQTPATAGYGFTASATGAGLLMLPVAALMLLIVPAAARLGTRLGPRAPLQAGTVCAAAAFVLLAAVHDHLWQFAVILLLVGAGYGLAFASIGTLVVNAVEPRHTGMATGINTNLRTIGGAVGAQIAAAILAASTPPSGHPPAESGYTTGFLTFAAIAVLALALTFPIGSRPRT